MKKVIIITAFTMSFILTGCNQQSLVNNDQQNTEITKMQQQLSQLQEENQKLKKQIDDSNKQFDKEVEKITNKIYDGELYSFQYPENLNITCSGPDAPKGLTLTNNDGISIFITHVKTNQGMTWKEWIDTTEMGTGGRVEDVTREEIKINNKDAYKRTMKVKDFFNANDNEVKSFLTEIFIANNPLNETTNRTDKLAKLALSIPNEEYQKYTLIFEDIVKSFEWK